MVQRAERVLVTGGAGFIGSHLVDRLLADGRAELVVFDNLSRGRLANLARHQRDRRLTVVSGDVRDAAAVAAVLHGVGTVYHLAARARDRDAAADVDDTFATNVVGTFNVLRAAVHQAVSRLIFASSPEAYGEPAVLPVDEGQPLVGIGAYGASKVAAEAYCRAFRQIFGLPTVILRFAHVYGPRDYGRPIPVWLERAAAGHALDVYGEKQVVDFVWVGLAVEALVRAAALDGPLPAINVASGTGTRVVDVARRIAHLAGSQSPIRILPARPAEVRRFVANVERMRQLLAIEPPLDPLAHLPRLIPARAAPHRTAPRARPVPGAGR